MKFFYKSILQHFFSKIPKGEQLNYLFQKHITKTFPVSNDKFIFKANTAFNHLKNFEEFNTLKNTSNKYYEFGAGWDLIVPLAICHLGYEATVVDIRRLLIDDLVKNSIDRFLIQKEKLLFDISDTDSNQLKNFNLKYYAPLDARNTKFSDNHFDFSSSTATLEHIPKDDILKILNETYRIMKKGGILSMTIDYRDHWAYFDKNISFYNFLIFSPQEWKKYNPSLNYQNRLRHSDYLKIISKTNFKIVKNNPILPNQEQKNALKSLKLANNYKHYSINDLEILGSEIVLIK